MSGTVFQRVVLAERTKDGFIRFADWALTTTPLGVCAEPFPGGAVGIGDGCISFDATDDIALVTDIHYINSDQLNTRLSCGNDVWCGGNLMPRTGR